MKLTTVIIRGDDFAQIRVLQAWADTAEAKGHHYKAADFRKQALDLLKPYGASR